MMEERFQLVRTFRGTVVGGEVLVLPEKAGGTNSVQQKRRS
jgi:hypothetical protein